MAKRKVGAGGGAAAAAKRARAAGQTSIKQFARPAIAAEVKHALLNQRTAGFLGLEKKFKDWEYDAAVVATVASSEADPATALSLTAIEQGDGPQNREGRRCTIQSVEMRGYVTWALGTTAATMANDFCRILLVRDKQTNGAQLSAEDVLVDPSDADLDVAAVRSLLTQQRFVIMSDFLVKPQARPVCDSLGSAEIRVPFKLFKKCNWVQNFSTTANPPTVSQCIDNSLHLIAIRSNGSGATCTLRYYARVRFMG